MKVHPVSDASDGDDARRRRVAFACTTISSETFSRPATGEKKEAECARVRNRSRSFLSRDPVVDGRVDDSQPVAARTRLASIINS